MSKIKRVVANVVLTIAEKNAKYSCGSASMFSYYQPKEPTELIQKLMSEKRK